MRIKKNLGFDWPKYNRFKMVTFGFEAIIWFGPNEYWSISSGELILKLPFIYWLKILNIHTFSHIFAHFSKRIWRNVMKFYRIYKMISIVWQRSRIKHVKFRRNNTCRPNKSQTSFMVHNSIYRTIILSIIIIIVVQCHRPVTVHRRTFHNRIHRNSSQSITIMCHGRWAETHTINISTIRASILHRWQIIIIIIISHRIRRTSIMIMVALAAVASTSASVACTHMSNHIRYIWNI